MYSLIEMSKGGMRLQVGPEAALVAIGARPTDLAYMNKHSYWFGVTWQFAGL